MSNISYKYDLIYSAAKTSVSLSWQDSITSKCFEFLLALCKYQIELFTLRKGSTVLCFFCFDDFLYALNRN